MVKVKGRIHNIYMQNEEKELLREKKSFEDDEFLSLYQGMEKEGMDITYNDSRAQICEDDIMNNSFDGETCVLLKLKKHHFDQYDRNRSTTDGSVRTKRR